jgi:DnaJ-class molecular chaperone
MSTTDTYLTICPWCKGSGKVIEAYTVVPCRDCGGEGLARMERKRAS